MAQHPSLSQRRRQAGTEGAGECRQSPGSGSPQEACLTERKTSAQARPEAGSW